MRAICPKLTGGRSVVNGLQASSVQITSDLGADGTSIRHVRAEGAQTLDAMMKSGAISGGGQSGLKNKGGRERNDWFTNKELMVRIAWRSESATRLCLYHPPTQASPGICR